MYVKEVYSFDGAGRRDVTPVRIVTTNTAQVNGRWVDVIPVRAVNTWSVQDPQNGQWYDVLPVMVVDQDVVVINGRPTDVTLVRVVSGELGFMPGAYLAMDFRWGQEKYRKGVGAGIQTTNFLDLDGATSVGGAGFGQALRNGSWSGNLPDGTPLIGDGGLGCWEARENVQARSNPLGAVVGSPGTPPTGWFIQLGLANGVNRSIAGVGTDAATGLPYVDVAFAGTFVAAENVTITSATNVFVTPASPGQVWSAANYWAVASGVLPAPATAGVSGTRVRFGNPGLLAQLGSSDAPNVSFATRQLNQNRTAPALTTTVGADWLWSFGAGQAVNCVVRLGHMQLEQGSFASPPIFTEATPATRTAVAQSVGGLVLPSGDFDIEQTFKTGTGSAQSRPFEYHNGTDSERIIILQLLSGALQANLVVGGAATAIATTLSPVPALTEVKAEIQRRGSIWRFAVNEAQVGGDVSAGVPAVNTVIFGQRRINTEFLNSTISTHTLAAA